MTDTKTQDGSDSLHELVRDLYRARQRRKELRAAYIAKRDKLFDDYGINDLDHTDNAGVQDIIRTVYCEMSEQQSEYYASATRAGVLGRKLMAEGKKLSNK